MTRFARSALLPLGGALLGAVLGAGAHSSAMSQARFSPAFDLLSIAGTALTPMTNAGLTALAGAVVGLTVSILRRIRGAERGAALAEALLLLNPVTIYALSQNAHMALFLAASMVVAGGAVPLAVARDYRAAILLGPALALAPFISSALLYFYPALFLVSPLISPWGLAPRNAAGFAVVIWSPFLMVLAGLFYLHWLLEPASTAGPGPAALDWNAAFASEVMVVAAGAGLITFAAFAASRIAAALAFLIGAGALALVHPQWLTGP